jgi:hypothetical protein
MNRILINVIIMITFSFSTFSCAKKPRPVKITRINILESGIYTMTEKDSNFYVNNSNEQKVFELEVKEVTNWKIVKKTDIVPRTQRVSFGVTYVVEGYKQHVIGKKHFIGLTFGPQFNYLPGRYGYQFFFKEQKLAEKFFTVYK